MKTLRFKNSQAAWEGIHDYFFNQEKDILNYGGAMVSGQMVAFDIYITIDKAWVRPSFDFGNMFGYRAQKWSGLVNNYVNKESLATFKEAVMEKEEKRAPYYNISMPFVNNHAHGKNCLLSLTATRRKGHSKPIISFNLRSSEITKRLLMDFLLVQRMAEFVYGKRTKVELRCMAINMYLNPEAFTMYDNHRSIEELRDKKWTTPFQLKILNILKKFKTCDLEEISYKVHKRCVRQLQRPNGIPLSGDRPMLAKDLKL